MRVDVWLGNPTLVAPQVAEKLREKQEQTGIRLLWGTSNLFSHRRYMNGGPTNPDPQVVAYAANQVCSLVLKQSWSLVDGDGRSSEWKVLMM